jgi:hypothetical protein
LRKRSAHKPSAVLENRFMQKGAPKSWAIAMAWFVSRTNEIHGFCRALKKKKKRKEKTTIYVIFCFANFLSFFVSLNWAYMSM